MGKRTSQLVVELLDRVSGPARRVAQSLAGMNRGLKDGGSGAPAVTTQERLHAAIARNDAALQRARVGIADSIGAYYALKTAIGGPVQAAREFEGSMADIRKVVDFPTPEAFKAFRNDLKALSRQVPISTTGLAEIAAAAGQAGIAGEDLVRFTDAAAKIGTAFDISAGEAGESMAKIMTGMGMTIDEAVLLSDAMNHLSNSQASSAAEILDVMKRVGATSKQYGYSAEQTAAFASAMIASGASSEVAATSFRNMGRALTKGESATKRQSMAFQKLGLDATEVAKRMQQDAEQTTVDVIERLAALPKEVQASVSSDLFGDEARALGPLLTNLDLVRSSLGLVEDKSKYAGSAFKEFMVRNAIFDSRAKRFGNTLNSLAVAIGEGLIPVLTSAMDIVEPFIARLTTLIEAHPNLTGAIFSTVGALVAFKGATSALRFVGLLGRGGALSLMAGAIDLIGVSSGTMATRMAASAAKGEAALAALEASTAARAGRMRRLLMFLGKGGLVGTAVYAGLAPKPLNTGPNGETEDQMLADTAAKWSAMTPEERQAMVDREFAAANAKQKPKPISVDVDALKAEAENLRATIADIQRDMAALGEGQMADQMGAMMQEALGERRADLEEVEAALADAEAATGGLTLSFGDLGAVEVTPQINTSSIDAAFERVSRLSRSMRGLSFPGQPSAGSVGDTPFSGARAKGGPVTAGNKYLVGENGPEPFTPTRSGYIHPNGGGGGAIGNVYVSLAPVIHAAAPGQEGAIVERLMDELETAMRRTIGGLMADTAGGL